MLSEDLDAQLDAALKNPTLLRAALALRRGRLPEAEGLLKPYLSDHPFDVVAIRLLAEVAVRVGRPGDAEILLRRALALAPRFDAARVNLASILYGTNRAAAALEQLAALEVAREENPNLHAAVLNRLGAFEPALSIYRDTLTRNPIQPQVWLSYGHVLKTVGRRAEGVAAYRRAIAIRPSFGEAWWSLANLKTEKFTANDIDTMEALLPQISDAEEDRFHLEFALGKAFEDEGDSSRAFMYYNNANAHRRARIRYDAAQTTHRVDQMAASFSPAFLAARRGWGCPAAAPIFIVGLPRSGSTLIEQVLASHSQVEAIAELPDIPDLWRALGDKPHEALAALNANDVARLGENYLSRIAPQRRTERPFFIDKLPNNWLYTGFIHLILRRAHIVDARRNPLSCGWANFRQHFARGQHFTYDLGDLGTYYSDYVRLMRHFAGAMPGVVHRVLYEEMVTNTDVTIKALLSALNLPFEAACREFHKTQRPVRTPSSEQVRSPIFTGGMQNWQAFDAWLGPLRERLSDEDRLR